MPEENETLLLGAILNQFIQDIRTGQPAALAQWHYIQTHPRNHWLIAVICIVWGKEPAEVVRKLNQRIEVKPGKHRPAGAPNRKKRAA